MIEIPTIKQKEIEKIVSEATNLTPLEVSVVINATLEAIKFKLVEDKAIEFPNFGTFYLRRTHFKTQIDPKTKTKYYARNKFTPFFKAKPATLRFIDPQYGEEGFYVREHLKEQDLEPKIYHYKGRDWTVQDIAKELRIPSYRVRGHLRHNTIEQLVNLYKYNSKLLKK